ncbi:MAG: radical SAM protein [Bacteroidota bacterium]
MFEKSLLNAFNRHQKYTPDLQENVEGTLTGGYSIFPRTRVVEGEAPEKIMVKGPIKASRFNSFVPYEDQLVAFNAFTQKFLVLDPVLVDLLNAAVLENDFPGLSDLHPSFYQELVNTGFLVEETTDELQKVIDLRNEVDFADDHYSLVINPTMNCNFKCWYCYESHIKGSKMNDETMEKIQHHISHIMETRPELKSFSISWFGGEPMLYYDAVVEPIIKFASQKAAQHGIHFETGFTSNGYMIRERMMPIFKAYNVNRFQITLDGVKEKHNTVRYTASKKGTFDKIVENIKLLCKNQIRVTVRINYTEETLDRIEELIPEFSDLKESEKEYILFSFHNVWQEKKPNTLKLEKIITNFRKHDFTTDSLFTSFDTLRDSCYADKKNQATINYDGEVFKCTARDFKADEREGVMTEEGAIVWNEKYEKRMNSKFNNSPCLSCRIQPICNGGCSQQSMENIGSDYCVVEATGMEKNDIIVSRFKQILEVQAIRRSKLVRRINQINRGMLQPA